MSNVLSYFNSLASAAFTTSIIPRVQSFSFRFLEFSVSYIVVAFFSSIGSKFSSGIANNKVTTTQICMQLDFQRALGLGFHNQCVCY